jgi:hypothetical protein
VTFAHVMGIPVEETALTLAPAGAALVTGAVIVTRSKLSRLAGVLRRRGARGTS